MARIVALRDALVADTSARIGEATSGYPTCTNATPTVVLPGQPGPNDAGCLTEIANALGSKQGFVPIPADQAAAATAALVIVRDGRGDWFAHVDGWLNDMKTGKGIGHDALRLAVARKMAEAAPTIGRKIEDDAAQLAAMKAVVAAVPGACPTYWLLGSGTDPSTLPAELSADHSACVQKDLARPEGPGARYGTGNLRAAEGALVLWRETERALRLGLPNAEPAAKIVLEEKLPIIEAATQKIETKKLPQTPAATPSRMTDVHAHAGGAILQAHDAGVEAATRRDAGAR